MKKFEQKVNYLAIYQIFSGVSGILFLFLMNVVMHSAVMILILALNLFSVYCGYLLLKKSYSKGFAFSLYNQIIQVVSFGIAGFAFKCLLGIHASFGIDITEDTLLIYNFGFSAFELNLGSNSQFFISVNSIAIILLGFIWKLQKFHENSKQKIII